MTRVFKIFQEISHRLNTISCFTAPAFGYQLSHLQNTFFSALIIISALKLFRQVGVGFCTRILCAWIVRFL